MTDRKKYETDIAIIGGGIAGIALALELLERGERRRITIIEGQDRQDFGGLAKSAFGGMMLVDTPEQKKSGIADSHELALKDWHDFADFDGDDHWPKAWAGYYVKNVTPMVRDWILGLGLKFLPAVQWVERGLFQPGNSVPRYHILYGTAQYLMTCLIRRLEMAAKNGHLTLLFNHKARKFITDAGLVSGIEGDDVKSGRPFSLMAGTIIIATGGIGGNHDKVRQNWPADWPKAPDRMLNGCHPSADGHFHDQTQNVGGRVTHLDRMWNYAAGIPHPHPRFDNHGLSLVPTRSSLWLDHRGRRIGPLPLITGFDTNFLCRQVVGREKPWSWHVMNWKIASRELAISGAEHNPDLRDRKFLRLVLKLLLADDGLLRQMVTESDDFIVADNLAELTGKMNALTGEDHISALEMKAQITAYDDRLAHGPKYHNDDQIRRIAQLRQWGGDRIRTCKFQRILDPKAAPLLAIRSQLITRKTLGGIQTNLDCAILKDDGSPIPNLFAIGEAAGFGGGGASGKRSLEGTFLSGCILTARRAAEIIRQQA